MSKRTRLILTFVAATLAAVVAAAGTMGLPPVVTVVLAAVVAGLAAIGIIPLKLTEPVHGTATSAYFTDPIREFDDVSLAVAAEMGSLPGTDEGKEPEKFAVILTALDPFGQELKRSPLTEFVQPSTHVLRVNYRDLQVNAENPAPFYITFVSRVVRFDPETDITDGTTE